MKKACKRSTYSPPLIEKESTNYGGYVMSDEKNPEKVVKLPERKPKKFYPLTGNPESTGNYMDYIDFLEQESPRPHEEGKVLKLKKKEDKSD